VNESQVFTNALKLATPAERAAYLDEVCAGNAELRAGVEALLHAHADDPGFLEQPAGSLWGTVDRPAAPALEQRLAKAGIAEQPGTVLGDRYKLLQPIGEGGMGDVWLAEQMQPVQRKVALKIIKAGMDSRQVLARFEAERQALALMDHPNIAKVLDGGTTESGRSFFVMELVKGQPITKYCDEQRLTPRERLELFIPVCQAIQHAHQKAIIHRDIKPSNVLVAPYDGKAVVKVIDFGVAKATGQALTDKTLFTEFGAVIGTLEYMSPEQAELNNQDIDTRSDIYSLGVLLYELLTGTTPLDRARLKKTPFTELLRKIREEEPPKPSTRLSEAKETLPAISAQRQMEPAKLAKLVRGELDWIVMKALEKDRNRRYESANGLAMDVQRYLADEPVQVCPPSVMYRFGKFARRNKAALAATTTAFLVLVLGVLGLAVSHVLITREKEKVAREKERGDQHLARAKKVMENFLGKTAEDRRLKLAGLHDLRKALLTSMISFLEEFAHQEGDGSSLRRERAWANSQLADIWRETGEDEKALHHCDLARAGWEGLAADFPAFPFHREQLAECDNKRGVLLTTLNRLYEAERSLHQALAVREQLVAEFPAVASHRSEVGKILHHLSLIERLRGKPQEERRLLEQAIVEQKAALRAVPGNQSTRLFLAHHLVNLEVVLREMGHAAEAAKVLGETRGIYESLLADFPTHPDYRAGLAACNINLGNQHNVGRPAEAAKAYRQAVAILDRLSAEFPAVPDYRGNLARAQDNLGHVLNRLQKHEEAEAAYGKALALREDLIKQHPGYAAYALELGIALINRGARDADAGRFAAALRPFTRAVEVLEPLAAPARGIARAGLQLRSAHGARADVLLRLGRHTEAVKDYDRALALDDGKERAYFRMQRALALAHLKGHVRAAAEAEAVAATPALPAYLLHDAAAVHALCSLAAREDAQLAERYAVRAVSLLRQAFKKNFGAIAEEVRKDPKLNLLRSREDFRQLWKEWEGKEKR
jgi:serine/threonine protein kinase/tetratricopeptide (TPR) repeat protein